MELGPITLIPELDDLPNQLIDVAGHAHVSFSGILSDLAHAFRPVEVAEPTPCYRAKPFDSTPI
jgi:hypothetical protein